MKNIKAVLFDFDGTIADTNDYTYSCLFRVLKKEKIAISEKDFIKKIRNENFPDLLKEWRISWVKLLFLLRTIRQMQEELYFKIDSMKVFPGIKKLLADLEKKNFQTGIVSSNLRKNVDKFLQKHEFEPFTIMNCESNILGKHRMLSYSLKKHHLKAEQVIYVGDEIRDIEACKKVGIKMIGVSWGLHSADALRKNGVDFIVKKPQEILKIID